MLIEEQPKDDFDVEAENIKQSIIFFYTCMILNFLTHENNAFDVDTFDAAKENRESLHKLLNKLVSDVEQAREHGLEPTKPNTLDIPLPGKKGVKVEFLMLDIVDHCAVLKSKTHGHTIFITFKGNKLHVACGYKKNIVLEFKFNFNFRKEKLKLKTVSKDYWRFTGLLEPLFNLKPKIRQAVMQDILFCNTSD